MERDEERRAGRYGHGGSDADTIDELAAVTEGSEETASEDADGAEANEDEDPRDLYLIEAARILSDLIELDAGEQRLAHRGQALANSTLAEELR
jgi:hypothetical protein